MATSLALESIVTERLNPHSGMVEKLPLLDASSCMSVSFLPYVPPRHEADPDPLWIEAIQELDYDLHWLLKQSHPNFWSQVVFDASLQKSLDSYLRNAPRSCDQSLNLPLKVKESLRNIHKRVFLTFLRMSTAKESETHYFTAAAHADIIYQNYLFDVPKLMDLCVLYGNSNKPLLAKLVANVFKVQPQYKKDWSMVVLSFANIFQKVSHEVLPTGKATLLTEKPKTLSSVELSDLILYLSDITYTLQAFLDVYPPAVEELMRGDFLETLVNFYESIVPVLQSQWLAASRSIADAPFLKSRFRRFKSGSAWIVNCVLRSYFQPSHLGSDSSQFPLDSFVSGVTTVLTEKCFLHEYEKCYSLATVVQEMQQRHPELPESHFDYIVSSLDSPKKKEKTVRDGEDPASRVKELLPHLGDGFIQMCLKEFGNSAEKVVDRVLEDNLPAHLKAVDQCMAAESSIVCSSDRGASEEATAAAANLQDERLNVYDHDEFDVFSEDISVDLSRVHFGKRHNPSSGSALLDDKAHLEETRELYEQYDVETSETYQGPGEDNQYEFDQYSDEYDDTYDSHEVGAADNDSADDPFSMRRLNNKGQYSRHFSQFPTVREDTGEEQASSHVTRAPPTILKRPSTHSSSKAKVSNPPARKPHNSKQPSSDVKPVEGDRARQLKEKNKGKRANHNRKAMADKKRSRGMGAPPR